MPMSFRRSEFGAPMSHGAVEAVGGTGGTVRTVGGVGHVDIGHVGVRFFWEIAAVLLRHITCGLRWLKSSVGLDHVGPFSFEELHRW